MIARAFERRKDINNGRLSISFGSTHDDPLGKILILILNLRGGVNFEGIDSFFLDIEYLPLSRVYLFYSSQGSYASHGTFVVLIV